MDYIIFTQKYRVSNVFDCTKQYDLITRVALESSASIALLDVHNKLFPQICQPGAETELTLCCYLLISDSKPLKASDKAYGGDYSIYKAVKGVNYCMNGTVFEFKEVDNQTVTVTISFGGLIFALTCKPDLVKQFKYGQKVYLVCCNTK